MGATMGEVMYMW